MNCKDIKPYGQVALENALLLSVFDARTGALLHIKNKETGWEIQGRNELARSFRLVVPLHERLLNLVLGEKQTVSSVHHDPSNQRLTFTWDDVESEHGGKLDIRLRAEVSLDNWGLTFCMHIENHSPYPVESCAYPYIGDLQHPVGHQQLERAHCSYDMLVRKSLNPEFQNERGYWGVDTPIQMVPTPETLFMLVLSDQEGLYVGCHDTSAKQRVELTFQLKPGYGKVGFVPKEKELSGQPAHIEFRAEHFPFVQPGEDYSLSPIVLKPFTGDWHAGADVYKSWRNTWMKKPALPAWLQDIHSWQQLQMTSWGDTLNIHYNDLIKYGEDCANHGVGAIQLTGWTLYGQDGRLPIHDIDPRLGTREELKAAIQQVQALGVKIILYEKYTCTDVGTDWYKDSLHQYASKDIFGNTHGHEGWRYDTPAHLAGINTRPYAWMCMNSAAWQDIAVAEARKSLELEPAGLLLDETMWHGTNAFYCFDANHGHRVPAYNFAGDAAFELKLRQALEASQPELVLAGEAPYDLQNRHYVVSYHRTKEGHIPGMRYIDPDLPMVNWVCGYDDRENINLCLLYRYIISYEPRHFRGRLDEFPQTLSYGKQVDSLRKRYSKYVWKAEFRDTVGSVVLVNGKPHKLYSVFWRPETNEKTIVVANHADTPLEAIVDTGKGERFWLVSPEDPEPAPSSGIVQIPARSVVVLLPATAGEEVLAH